MDIRISARFWSKKDKIPNLDGFDYSIEDEIKKSKKGDLFYAATADVFKVSSLSEALEAVTKLYDSILSSQKLQQVLSEGCTRGEVWVVSFGDRPDLQGAISKELMEKIKSSNVSLFDENYPLTGDENPNGYFIVKFND